MLRYSSLQRVWFGYKFTGDAAWYAVFPHLALYAAACTARHAPAMVYLASLRLPDLRADSQIIYMALYPFGWATGTPLPPEFVRGEWLFLAISVPLELGAAALVWRTATFSRAEVHLADVGRDGELAAVAFRTSSTDTPARSREARSRCRARPRSARGSSRLSRRTLWR